MVVDDSLVSPTASYFLASRASGFLETLFRSTSTESSSMLISEFVLHVSCAPTFFMRNSIRAVGFPTSSGTLSGAGGRGGGGGGGGGDCGGGGGGDVLRATHSGTGGRGGGNGGAILKDNHSGANSGGRGGC